MERPLRTNVDRPLAIVVGANDVGSATAVALHRAGYAVVVCEDVDPAWLRRGMAFTNAWYVGGAEVDGIDAVFCASVRSIPTVLSQGELVAATTWSWSGVAASLAPAAVVHASRRAGADLDLRATPAHAWTAVGIGAGFVAGGNVDLIVESAPGSALGSVIRSGPALPRTDVVRDLAGVGNERFVRASASGRFVTRHRIGAAVVRGEHVGAIGMTPVIAPISGVLRGLTARGALVREGIRVVEVDPRGDPTLCFGMGERPRAIAEGVLAALAERNIASQPPWAAARSSRELTA